MMAARSKNSEWRVQIRISQRRHQCRNIFPVDYTSNLSLHGSRMLLSKHSSAAELRASAAAPAWQCVTIPRPTCSHLVFASHHHKVKTSNPALKKKSCPARRLVARDVTKEGRRAKLGQTVNISGSLIHYWPPALPSETGHRSGVFPVSSAPPRSLTYTPTTQTNYRNRQEKKPEFQLDTTTTSTWNKWFCRFTAGKKMMIKRWMPSPLNERITD